MAGENNNSSDKQKVTIDKETIIEILNSESLRLLKKSLIGALDRSGLHMGFHIIRGIGFAMLIAAGLVGYYLQWNANMVDREIEQLRSSIATKIVYMDRINASMGHLRKEIYKVVLGCTYNKPLPEYEQRKQIMLARLDVAQTIVSSGEIFNSQVQKKLLEFTALQDNVADICEHIVLKDASDGPWREIVKEVNKLMADSIEEDKQKILELARQK